MENAQAAERDKVLTAFPLFPLFPREIRDRIWEQAWPASCIHFLRVVDAWNRKEYNEIIKGPSQWDFPFSLGLPRGETRQRVNWVENDPSMYLFTNHLRQTCRESRDAVLRLLRERAFGKKKVHAWTLFGVRYYGAEDPGCFYLHKKLDIICLEFRAYEDGSPYWLAPRRGPGFWLPMLKDQEQIAIEYKPEWDAAFKGGPADFLGLAPDPIVIVPELAGPKWVPFHFPKLRCFYVIDYSITRSQRQGASVATDPKAKGASSDDNSEANVFSSNGKTFYVVKDGDESWTVSSQAHALVAWLRDEYPSTLTEDRGEFTNWGYRPKPPAAEDFKFKVLAAV
ncbi:hypothetical protein QBC46DRAFT_425742 [Diplogelasinospora grovesii]|uniref:2EXR domain-containing protein n=1 Tax=Diplogelasinospora grovesii TaxID=303347 RepID=A0AAN6NCE7_9PEZI|nr:hypothetical protein QBC46DRAFT_425742 [Diplogelasinospora grovesii]